MVATKAAAYPVSVMTPVTRWQNRAARETAGDLVGRRSCRSALQKTRRSPSASWSEYSSAYPSPITRSICFTAHGRRRRAEISSVMVEGGEPYQAVFGIAVIGSPRPASAVHLTKRQNEVLELLGEGASTGQIAATLHLSRETVRNYVRQVLRASRRALAARSGGARASRGLSRARGLVAYARGARRSPVPMYPSRTREESKFSHNGQHNILFAGTWQAL